VDGVVEGGDVLRNENWDDGRGGERGYQADHHHHHQERDHK
jgi:hypothetical protein